MIQAWLAEACLLTSQTTNPRKIRLTQNAIMPTVNSAVSFLTIKSENDIRTSRNSARLKAILPA